MAHRILARETSPTTVLRFLARGMAMVPDYAAQESGMRRFHGWKHDPSLGPEFVDPVDKQTKHHGGFVKLESHVVEVPLPCAHMNEYLKHLQEGDLWPADEATAHFCGRPFEPEFGDEHPALAAKLRAATPEEH